MHKIILIYPHFQNGGLCRLDGYNCACNSNNDDGYDCFRGATCDTCQCTGKCAECFPSSAKVRLENGKSVTMSELQIKDQVQTGMFISVTHLKPL